MLELKNIAYKAADRDILPPQSLSIQPGNHLLLLGPSGCGKTTLMNLMAGLLRPSAGEISFNGQDYASLPDAALDRLRAENFGFVFQKLHLIGHLTAAQNVAVAQTKEDKGRIQSLLAELGLGGKENQKARDLSVGEAQRVAIARAVVNNPKVIFADEPTSALDHANTEKIIELVFDQARKTGASVIAATHDDRIKSRFDTVWEMAA